MRLLYLFLFSISVHKNDAHGFCEENVAFSDQNPVILINKTAGHFVHEYNCYFTKTGTLCYDV